MANIKLQIFIVKYGGSTHSLGALKICIQCYIGLLPQSPQAAGLIPAFVRTYGQRP